MSDIGTIIDKCRPLTTDDNEKDMDHWILERRCSRSDGYYSSSIKTGKLHFVSYQNGSLESWISPRRRIGLWNFDRQHISGLDIMFNGRSEKETFVKYVRGYAYIYRQFEDFERLDFIPNGKSIFEIELRSSFPGNFKIEIQVLHETAWPESEIGKTYEVKSGSNLMEIGSNLAKTIVSWKSNGNVKATFKDNKIKLLSQASSKLSIYISCDGSLPEDGDLESSIEYNESINKISHLVTPSFKINKLFRWAKHDLLELFTPTPIGNGFYAGIPQFSWFFGRDGEWMSMAAIECGMFELAQDHLDLLFTYSKNGRIPHEIPLSNSGHIDGHNFFIENTPISTQYMSIDSSPLWIICEYMLSEWTGKSIDQSNIQKVVDFCMSCDRDHDGLLENRFSEQLIGWPESWAKERNGICIEVNAWWLEALRVHNFKQNAGDQEFKLLLNSYKEKFYKKVKDQIVVLDSINENEKREIKGAMQIVPAIYFNGDVFADSLSWLYEPDIVTEWGVRSVSDKDGFYDGGYHTGTVWPLMTGWMALALYKNFKNKEAYEMVETFTKLAFSSLEPGRINETYNPEFLNAEGQFFQGWSSSLFIQSIIEGMLGFANIPSDEALSANITSRIPQNWDEVKLINFPFRGKIFNITFRSGGAIEIDEISESTIGEPHFLKKTGVK